MSAIEYNKLIFKVCQRLNELNGIKQLLFMCRGKVAPRSEENLQDSFSLFEELEEKELLGPDRLDVLKDLLGGFEEWSLLENVEKFEAKRKEYDGLIEQIIQALGEMNDVERILLICREKIAEERQSTIHDVPSLIKELKNNNALGINHLGILKEILEKTDKRDLLERVEEFEARKSRENKFERRKAQAAAMASSACGNLRGVLNVKNVFKGIAGGIVIASAFELLRRGSTYDQLVTAINTCVLPAGAKLIQMTEGSLNLKVQAENRLAVDSLWRMYKNGTLKARLEALLVTDEMRELVGGEGVEVIVTIDEQEYEKARSELTVEGREDPNGKEGKRLKYLDQEKYDYIQNYLEKNMDIDVQSVMTDTSDSGMPGSHSASSDAGTEETSDALPKLCLKDVREQVTEELTSRLKSDLVALERFCQSFGLDPVKLRTKGLWDIKTFFPDTPVKTVKDVFEALKLFDLAELLEKETKPKTLRPALSLKEIEKLPSASNRPTKIYTKAEVLIISFSERDVAETEKLGSFFKGLNTQSEVTTLKPKLFEGMNKLRVSALKKEEGISRTKRRVEMLNQCLEKKIPRSWHDIRSRVIFSGEQFYQKKNNDEQLLSMFYAEEAEMKIELKEQTKKIEQLTKELISITEEKKQKEEEVKKENDKFKTTFSSHIDKWIEKAQDKGNETTLFVVCVANRFASCYVDDDPLDCLTNIERVFKEKLSLIPNPKLVIIDEFFPRRIKLREIPHETLQVYLQPRRIGHGTILELLNKRYKSLDLIAVMMELKRTFSKRHDRIYGDDDNWYYHPEGTVVIQENLSCLPKLQQRGLK